MASLKSRLVALEEKLDYACTNDDLPMQLKAAIIDKVRRDCGPSAYDHVTEGTVSRQVLTRPELVNPPLENLRSNPHVIDLAYASAARTREGERVYSEAEQEEIGQLMETRTRAVIEENFGVEIADRYLAMLDAHSY